MKKAVAIPYVIALIIGVIVVAVLAYWFIVASGKGGTIGVTAECRARMLDMCLTGEAARSDAEKVCSANKISSPNPDADICKFCKSVIPGWDTSKITGCKPKS